MPHAIPIIWMFTSSDLSRKNCANAVHDRAARAEGSVTVAWASDVIYEVIVEVLVARPWPNMNVKVSLGKRP